MLLVLLLSAVSCQALAGAGDEWRLVRGDASPGVTYNALVQTASGRLLAAGDGGQLMISDDGGTSWRYDVITINGTPLFGRVSDLIRKGSQIIGTVNSYVSSSNEFGLPLQGLTQLISSSDNGNSWQLSDFPITEASFFGRTFPGVYLEHLHLSPSGDLLAYGTASLGSASVAWSIGGAVFRNTGGSNWEQAFYELGPLNSMSDANGRLVAAGFRTVIDSPDGAAWNGYLFDDAQLTVNGQPLGDDVLRRLSASDITYRNGNYVMQTQAYKPLPGHPNILTGNVDRTFTFRSANPFDGGRMWQGAEHDRLYPFYLNMGGSILSMLRGVYSTSDAGQSWSLVDADVDLVTRSYARVGGNSAVAVRSSENVWRSDNGGSNWNKVYEVPYIPDLDVDLRVGNILYAREPYDSQGTFVYRSLDNGLTWTQIADVNAQTGTYSLGKLQENNGILFANEFSDQIAVSADGGFTWQTRPLPTTNSEQVSAIVTQRSGRMIGFPHSRSIDNLAAFHYSDDNGATWQRGVPLPLEYGDSVKGGIALRSGRIIGLYNSFASFDPQLFISDDNGVNWRREDPFTGLEGLQNNGGEERFLELKRIFETRSGRVVILGDEGEILTSDDRGESWVVRKNLELFDDGDFHDWSLHEIVQVGERLIIPGTRREHVTFAYISEDDGTSWREVPIKLNIANTALYDAMVGRDGRVIFTGSNGAEYVSDSFTQPAGEPAREVVRESESVTIMVPRPPADGAVTARYNATGIEAVEGADFVALAGTLEWAEGDQAPKPVVLQTIEDSQPESDESLSIDVHVAAQANATSLVLDTSYLVVIKDNEGTGQVGVDVLTDGPLQTSETGDSDTFRLVLTRAPTASVTLNLTVDAPDEISLSSNSLTFTPGEWNQPQTVTVTGLDDSETDRDVAVQISVDAVSADSAYDELEPVSVYVTNLDDEYPTIFSNGFE